MSGNGSPKRKAMEAEMEEKRRKVEDEQVTKGEMEEEQEVDENLRWTKNLSANQKLALQEQIISKAQLQQLRPYLRKVLQAIPYNLLATRQKEILAKLSKEPRFTTHSPVSTPLTCLLCKEKIGRELCLEGGGLTSEVTEHYKLCLYKLGRLQAIVPPQPINTNSEGEAIDEIGMQFVYKCKVPNCDRGRRGGKLTAYKEYVFHCYQSHGLMKLALEDSMENTKDLETKQKFWELTILALLKPENVVEHVETIAKPEVEEIHTCLLCKGINRDTKKEIKEAKALKFNICITRNHYANCLNETEEGKVYFENTYKTPGDWVRIKCDTVQCRNQKRLRDGFTSAKVFYSHMALHHGGLETWMLSQDREDLRELVPRLLCKKRPEVCFVPDHYGQ